MSTAACGGRGFKGRARGSGERPIGAARCRQQCTAGVMPPPPPRREVLEWPQSLWAKNGPHWRRLHDTPVIVPNVQAYGVTTPIVFTILGR